MKRIHFGEEWLHNKNPLYTYLPPPVTTVINSDVGTTATNQAPQRANVGGNPESKGCSEPELETFLRSVVQASPEDFTTYMAKTFFLHNNPQKSQKQPRPKSTYLSLTERRKLGLYNLNKTGLKFQEFLPLHKLWKEYMMSFLNIDFLKATGFVGSPLDAQWEQFSRRLVKADFHGAKIEVTRSKCSSLVGKTGIIVFDTKNTFKIIGEDNVVRTIPKETSVFAITLDVYKLTVFGKHLCIRPAERSVKKIKTHMTADL